MGRPLETAQEAQQRLPKVIALPVFSSDAISSTAYATEEILLVLVLAGVAALQYSIWIALAVAGLLVIVAISYQQTVRAYPSGGGSYVVSTENLGVAPGLVAAASLLVDYVMTVAVSAASGVAAITAALPALYPYRVPIAVGAVLLLALANLRGVRESGRLFAVPTYAFVALCGGLVILGNIKWLGGGLSPLPAGAAVEATRNLSVFLILRAFAGGCSAMTGTEAISNAVPAFKPPESRNASLTLGIMAAILGTLLLGVTNLARVVQAVPQEGATVLSEIGKAVYGNGFFYYALQIATMAILILAANTSFTGFPRLSYVLASNGVMPRQFANRGDRLVYSNGVIGLALLAIIVIVIFDAQVHSMIPLYAVGVFTAFTLSQAGMVRHWRKLRGSGWWWRVGLNGLGALLTGVVAIVVVVVKFTSGAFIIVVVIPLVVLFFYGVRGHYRMVAAALFPRSEEDYTQLRELAKSPTRTTMVLLVSSVNQLTARALAFVRLLSPADVHAVTVTEEDPQHLDRLFANWDKMESGIRLEVLESPYRELVRPVLEYVRGLHPGPDNPVGVIIPEFVVEHWWQAFLHNQAAWRLKGALLFVPWVSVISVPFWLGAAKADTSKGAGEAAGPGGDDSR